MPLPIHPPLAQHAPVDHADHPGRRAVHENELAALDPDRRHPMLPVVYAQERRLPDREPANQLGARGRRVEPPHHGQLAAEPSRRARELGLVGPPVTGPRHPRNAPLIAEYP